jgi:hypothetical protein
MKKTKQSSKQPSTQLRNFDINRIPRKWFLGGIGALIIILLAVNIFQPSHFQFRDTTDYEQRARLAVEEEQEYANYLASIKPDPVASKQLYQELLNPKEVEAEVAQQLNVRQPITIPTIPDNKVAFTPRGGKEEVVNYFNQVGKLVIDLNTEVKPVGKSLFAEGVKPRDVEQSLNSASQFLEKLYQTPVPREAAEFHKAELVAFEQYKGLLEQAHHYSTGTTDNPWPKVYGNYAVIDSQVAVADREFQNLDKQYKLSQIEFFYATSDTVNGTASLPFVKQANAQFGFGTVIIGVDIPRTAREVLEDALGAAFANFFTVFLDKLIEKLESNYKISNFLYYTDALISGQYLNDYLNKYVPNQLDRSLIQRFIPQISCAGNQDDLAPIFTAKAKEYFNPNELRPTDRDFYDKIAKAGNITYSTPIGQEALFRQYASGALARSYDAALTELLNQNGLKVPRTTAGKAIATTVGSIAGQLQAAINNRLGLGSYNPNSIVSKLVSAGLTEFEKRFIFKGVVLKEQDTCIPYPQLQPVIPGNPTIYTPPLVPETQPRGTQ